MGETYRVGGKDHHPKIYNRLSRFSAYTICTPLTPTFRTIGLSPDLQFLGRHITVRRLASKVMRPPSPTSYWVGKEAYLGLARCLPQYSQRLSHRRSRSQQVLQPIDAFLSSPLPTHCLLFKSYDFLNMPRDPFNPGLYSPLLKFIPSCLPSLFSPLNTSVAECRIILVSGW